METEQTTTGTSDLNKTILVVDDEPGILQLVAAILSAQPYRVLLADSGLKALEIYREYGSAIDLVLTDVMMPGMSGLVLAERMKATRQNLPVLYMTGGTLGSLAAGSLDRRVCLLKPFDPMALINTIHSFLEAVDA